MSSILYYYATTKGSNRLLLGEFTLSYETITKDVIVLDFDPRICVDSSWRNP